MKKNRLSLIVVFLGSLIVAADGFCISYPIAPPNMKVIDDHNVNILSGQVEHRIKTVSIGGDLGISHTFQPLTTLWAEGFYGFRDGFSGGAKYTKLSEAYINIRMNNGKITKFEVGSPQPNHVPEESLIKVMRVYAPVGSQDFMVYSGGYIRNATTTPVQNYSYRPLGDQRHSLSPMLGGRILRWTLPDGTEVDYERDPEIIPNPGVTDPGELKAVTYPNGFKLRFSEYAVSTNTGYMLKYKRVASRFMPDKIVALNMAHQSCDIDNKLDSCNSSGNWPEASFQWPSDPEKFKTPGLAEDNYKFSVVDQQGATTVFKYKPVDICVPGTGGSMNPACITSASQWVSWLESIKMPGSLIPNYEYEFRIAGDWIHFDTLSYWEFTSKEGIVKRATYNGWERLYTYNDSASNGGVPATEFSNDGQDILARILPSYLGIYLHVESKRQGSYLYYEDLRRFVDTFSPVVGSGPKTKYEYDSRDNLSKIRLSNSPYTILAEAQYPTYCSSGETKTCNNPSYVLDARGKRTDYTYDPQSRFSDPIKITEPADANGVRKATVFKYEQLSAYYKNDSGNIVPDSDAIWLLTEEHTCRFSDATETGCTGGSTDMIQTEYYYGPQNSGIANNLHLRGKSITAAGNSGSLDTRVWCYEYDKYGNMIGESRPKGNGSSAANCP